MTEYKCLRCGYMTTLKGNFEYHIFSRKLLCKPVLQDVSRHELIEDFNNKQVDMKHKTIKKERIACTICNTTYSSRSSFCHHKKQFHAEKDKDIPSTESFSEVMSTLMQKIDAISMQMNSLQTGLVTVNQTNPTFNNVIINSTGPENMA